MKVEAAKDRGFRIWGWFSDVGNLAAVASVPTAFYYAYKLRSWRKLRSKGCASALETRFTNKRVSDAYVAKHETDWEEWEFVPNFEHEPSLSWTMKVTIKPGIHRVIFKNKDTTSIQQELDQLGMFQLVTGPSGSGKTRTYWRALEGRNNFIYISLRGACADDNFIDLISYQVASFPKAPEAGDFLHGFHLAVRKLYNRQGVIPLVVIDDPQQCFQPDGTLLPGAVRFFAALVNLHKAGMLNVVFLSSSGEAERALRRLPGYGGCLTVKEHPYMVEEIEKALRNCHGEHVAKRIVDRLGGNMDHINQVLAACEREQKRDEKGDQNASLEAALDAIVSRAAQELYAKLLMLAPEQLVIAHEACLLLAERPRNGDEPVRLRDDELYDTLKKKGFEISGAAMLATKEELLRLRVLRQVDGSCLEFQNQAQKEAFLEPRPCFFQDALSEAQTKMRAKESSVN